MTRNHLLLALLLSLLLLPTNGWSTTYEYGFGDSTIYWGKGTAANNGTYAQLLNQGNSYNVNSKDTNGGPDLTGGRITVANGILQTVEIYYNANNEQGIWSLIKPGDLFIAENMSANAQWDYVVDMNTNQASTADYAIHAFSAGLYDKSSYRLSNDTWTAGIYGSPAGGNYVIRDNHPVEADPSAPSYGAALGTAHFSGLFDAPSVAGLLNPGPGWVNPGGGAAVAIWDLSMLGLNVSGDSLTIGFGPNCANDVLLETVAIPAPEPSTFAFLGLGLGILGYACNRRAHKTDPGR
jgi:hypothetical protein